MKLSDQILQFPGWESHRQGLCRIRTFLSPTGTVFALVTDIGNRNPGPSITNAIEHVHAALIERGIVLPGAQLVEHYEDIDNGHPTYHLVKFDESGSPSWQSISAENAKLTLQCESEELSTMTLSIPRLAAQIDQMLTAIDPFSDSPWPEAPAIINRRADIEADMVSKRELQTLVEGGATERELQAVLKRDMSIFGELYASPREHYIAFSEFPLADGFVDFTLFTSTSRMEIVLIEIKGANFYLTNKDSYGEFSQPVNRAAGQIRKRVGEIYRDLPTFRKHAHAARLQAEIGNQIYNSFLGPQCPLEVDPKKDITIRTIVIGGRTRDDLLESKKRHDFEYGGSPPIKIESWDTWLRKLRRQ